MIETLAARRCRARALHVVAFVALTWAMPADAQERSDSARTDSTRSTAPTQMLRTRSGSVLYGRTVGESGDSVRFETPGGVLTLARAEIAELRPLKGGVVRSGQYWPADPSDSRLFFAPTARMLRRGEGYFSDTYIFFANAVGGVTDHVTLGGGMSLFPSNDITNNVFYLTPKVGVVSTETFSLATGALIGYIPHIVDSRATSFGVLYGVATAGSAQTSATFGAGWGYLNGHFGQDAALMLGGSTRVARRISLLTENYYITGVNDGAVSYGIRFFGDKLSTDLAFFNSPHDWLFPGIPFVSFAVKF